MIRDVHPSDAKAIADIYNYYISNTTITFEEQTVSESDMVRRIDKVHQQDLPWVVAEIDSKVVGYAYATPWKARSAYRFSVESTVYVSNEVHAKGLGTRLYQALFSKLQARDVNAVLGVITLPNEPSVALHEKLGMAQAAHFKQVGYKFGQWLDVGYWQINLHTD
ncbi:arsinothricin resistance N-acetyltransferase ArsN1 family B [Pseudoalteromonas sp. SSDWG2]|uniref:arsinothricin resistance N-acetyltransferase ArsN1 family B n=1 Tax=Pseudoalteromonas sp. SSDWG2 TaxID=3139391 RepID=UPI003BAD0F30